MAIILHIEQKPGALGRKNVSKFLERARDLLTLAGTVRSEEHRKLLLDSAEKFLKLTIEEIRQYPKH